MKEYWTDTETGISHKILKDGDDYIVIDGDTTFYLDDEDVYDEEELEEMRREEWEAEHYYDPSEDLSTYHSLSLWATAL